MDWSPAAAARRFHTTAKTVAKWVKRFREEGVAGLRDAPPTSFYRPNPPAGQFGAIEGCVASATLQAQTPIVAAAVKPQSRAGLSLRLQPLSAPSRSRLKFRHRSYRLASFVHLDIKSQCLNAVGHRITGDKRQPSVTRGVGFEFVRRRDRTTIPDCDRRGSSPTKKKGAIAALPQDRRRFRTTWNQDRSRDDRQRRSCYRSKAFAMACRQLGIKHIMTKPPHAADHRQGRALHSSALREWAYATAFEHLQDQHAAFTNLAAPVHYRYCTRNLR